MADLVYDTKHGAFVGLGGLVYADNVRCSNCGFLVRRVMFSDGHGLACDNCSTSYSFSVENNTLKLHQA